MIYNKYDYINFIINILGDTYVDNIFYKFSQT